MIDGEEIAETHIPIDDIQKEIQRKGLGTILPGVNRIKISAGTQMKTDECMACLPGMLGQVYITDADTGQSLVCFGGIEIINDITYGNRVKLTLDEGCFELDYHIKQQFYTSTAHWGLRDAQDRAMELQSQLKSITDEAETLRFKIHQLESATGEGNNVS